MSKKTVEQRIERAHYSIMKHPSFCVWSGLLFIGKWTVVDDFPTAAVDMAGNVRYGRQFVESLPMVASGDPYLNFVVLHETGHKALLHLSRGLAMFKEDPMLANIAADHVVNNMIEDTDPNGQFAKMPEINGVKIGCCDPKYKGWSMKEVYTDLKKQCQGQGQGKGKGQKGTGNGLPGGGQPMDEHDLSGGEQGQPMTEEQIDALEKAVDQALRSGQYLAGKQGGNAKRLLGDILEPKIDWREQLQEFAQEAMTGDDEATWKRPYRRFIGEDIYLPSYHTETMGEMGCFIDVSGSVGDAEMTACLSEVVEAARVSRPSKLHLWYWDDGIRRREEYTPDQYDDIVRLTKPTGGGGTDLEEVAEEANKMENLQCAIILTDGFISGGWRTWNMPVLWVLTTKNMLADCGKSLYIDV